MTVFVKICIGTLMWGGGGGGGVLMWMYAFLCMLPISTTTDTSCFLCVTATGMTHIVLFLGIYIRYELGTKAELLKSYNPDVLFHMMLSISATLIIFHGPASKICYDCGNWKTRYSYYQWRRSRGGSGGTCPPNFLSVGATPPQLPTCTLHLYTLNCAK